MQVPTHTSSAQNQAVSCTTTGLASQLEPKVADHSSAFTQLTGFALSGGISTAAHWLVLIILISHGLHPLLATFGGAVLGSVVNYLLQYHYTFNRAVEHRFAIPAYVGVVAVGWCVNTAVFWSLTSGAGLAQSWAQVCATAVVTAANFILYAKVVFNERIDRVLAA